MRIEILDSARQDLIAGHGFYERQAVGLGGYFLDTLFSPIDSLLLFAGIHPVVMERYHRLLSKRFPFAVYYRVDDNVVRVYAVLDCRQDPVRVERRLQGSEPHSPVAE